MRRSPVGATLLIAFTLTLGCSERSSPAPESRGAEPEVLERILRPVDGGAVHLVRLAQSGDSYAFEPAEVRASPGDVIRFVMVGQQPESVAFDTAGASPEVAAFVREHSLHLGVLLTDPGQAYDVSLGDAPAGRYPFFSRPHSELGMRGVVVVGEGAH